MDKKKKILVISRKYPPSIGGMQAYSRSLVKNLSGIYDVFPVVLGKEQVHLIWFLPYAAIMALWKVIFSGYRVVCLCDGLLAPLGLFIKSFLRAKVMVTVHGLDITYKNRFYQAIVPRSIAAMDRIVCVSRNTLKICVEKGVSKDKCVFIPNGIDTCGKDILEKKRAEGMNRLFDILGGNACGKKILLTVGRLVERKGIVPFIENIFPVLGDDFIYFIAGEGPLRKEIEEILFVKGIKGVHVLGKVDDALLEALYSSAYVLIMPNIKLEGDPEGFGIVALEASSRGLPVIAYDVDGIAEAVIDGETGWLVDPGDSDTFIKRIRTPELEKRSIISVSEKFEWKNIAEKYRAEINAVFHCGHKKSSGTAARGGVSQEENDTAPGIMPRVFSVTMAPISLPFDDGPKNIVYWIARIIKNVKFYFVASSPAKDFERYDNMVFFHSPFQKKRHHNMPFLQKIYVSALMLFNLPAIDVFQFFFTPNKLFSSIWGKILKITGKKSIQVITSVHNMNHTLGNTVPSSVLNSDIIITQSEYTRSFLSERGVKNARTIYPGIDTGRYDPEKYRGVYDGLDKDTRYVLYPGNYGLLQQAFSFEEFLSIVKAVTGAYENVKFIMACRIRTDKDQMLEETFKKLANEHNISDKMVYFNTVENMPALMASCDIGILPARKNMIKILELPLVILEMGALGKPFIYGNVRPLEELKQKGIGDCPKSNIKEEYVEMVARYIDRAEKSNKVIPEIRVAVLRDFTIGRQAMQFEKVYYELCGGK